MHPADRTHPPCWAADRARRAGHSRSRVRHPRPAHPGRPPSGTERRGRAARTRRADPRACAHYPRQRHGTGSRPRRLGPWGTDRRDAHRRARSSGHPTTGADQVDPNRNDCRNRTGWGRNDHRHRSGSDRIDHRHRSGSDPSDHRHRSGSARTGRRSKGQPPIARRNGHQTPSGSRRRVQGPTAPPGRYDHRPNARLPAEPGRYVPPDLAAEIRRGPNQQAPLHDHRDRGHQDLTVDPAPGHRPDLERRPDRTPVERRTAPR